ncbi:MAG TPA: hypothetical protein VF940_11905 [Streptosporangiaceae bacterium]
MGTAIGILLVAATIGSFVAINIRARGMSLKRRQSGGGSIIDSQTGPPEADHGSRHHGGHHGGGSIGGGHHGGDNGGGHFGGFSGGDFGGGHHG